MVAMGLFDSLHTGDRCGQVKCLGKRLADIVPGDEVVLHRIATPEELAELGGVPDGPGADADWDEFSEWSNHPAVVGAYDGNPRPERSWQVPMSDGSFAVFDDGRFVGFADDLRDGVLVVDNAGRDVTSLEEARTGWMSPPGRCEVCAQLTGSPDR